ncbi:MAG: Dockerin type 1, partial [uncultured bacterium]
MKTNSGRLYILTLIIMFAAFGATFFSFGCFINDDDTVVIESNANNGEITSSKMFEFSGSVSDIAAASVSALKTASNPSVSRAIELDANKNYIDVIDCSTGISVGTGALGPNGTFSANVDILKHAGKSVMIVIGNKNADGGKGPSLYKCFLGRMPNLSELPDTSLFDSVKIKNINLTYETTAKALFAVEKELYKISSNCMFSFTTSEIQADKSVSKQYSFDSIFDKKIELESGGAGNIAQVAIAVKTISIIASSNLSDGDKSNLIRQNIGSVTDALNAYSRIVAGSVNNTVISNIITQNSIPTEIKLETDGGVITIDNNTIIKPVTPEIIQNITSIKTVETPVFNIKDGEYEQAQTVIISTPTEGATIVYTLDGTEPLEGAGTKYDSPVMVFTNTTIKAAAYKPGMVTSLTAYLKISITGSTTGPAIASLSVETPETQTAGKGFSFTIKALDKTGALVVNDKTAEIKLSSETTGMAFYPDDRFAEMVTAAFLAGGTAQIYARGTKAGKTEIKLSANGIEAVAAFKIIA